MVVGKSFLNGTYLACSLYVGTYNSNGEITMDLKNLSVFSMAEQNMQYLSAREKVLAGNIANASTPGYLPKDIEKPDFGNDLVANMPLKLTNSKHMSGANFGNNLKVYTPEPTSALTIDGNGVILEEQMNEASKASSEYKRMITVYNKYKSMIQLANTKISA